jgi:hypothetical protein
MRLGWAVGALEPCAFTQLGERLFSDDVSAWHHHGRILVGRLLFRHWTDEDGVEVVGWR